MTRLTRRTILAAAPGALAATALPARAAKQYGPGVTDTEIKVGNLVDQRVLPKQEVRGAPEQVILATCARRR